MTAWQFVTYESDEDICVITMSRPDRRNAVDRDFAAELLAAFERFEADPVARVAVFTGGDGHFCAGADLKSVADPNRRDPPALEGPRSGPMGPTRMMLSKPVIAAVSGYAVAGGLELSLIADMRVADEDAVFGVFCRRWGVPLIDGGTVRLPRIVGMGHAMDMILTGRPVGAAEAASMGLVNRVTPKGGALAAARELAHQIAAFPPGCVLTDRRSAYEQWPLALPEALANEARLSTPMVKAEGMSGAARFAAGAGRHGRF